MEMVAARLARKVVKNIFAQKRILYILRLAP
jgi:hypothetical protein